MKREKENLQSQRLSKNDQCWLTFIINILQDNIKSNKVFNAIYFLILNVKRVHVVSVQFQN